MSQNVRLEISQNAARDASEGIDEHRASARSGGLGRRGGGGERERRER